MPGVSLKVCAELVKSVDGHKHSTSVEYKQFAVALKAATSHDSPVKASTPNRVPAVRSSAATNAAIMEVDLAGLDVKDAARLTWERLKTWGASHGHQKVASLFKQVDTDNSLTVEAHEFMTVLEHVGVTGCSLELVAAIMHIADPGHA